MNSGKSGGIASCIALSCMIAAVEMPAQAEKLLTVGIVETVRLDPGNITLEAKIDTGADNSSLDARDIEFFSRNSEKWVRFKVPLRDGPKTMELPFVRMTKTKRAGAPSAERPVVRMTVCLGTLAVPANVNLTDRAGLDYRMLIGRSILAGRTLVDPRHKNLTEPRCEEPAK